MMAFSLSPQVPFDLSALNSPLQLLTPFAGLAFRYPLRLLVGALLLDPRR